MAPFKQAAQAYSGGTRSKKATGLTAVLGLVVFVLLVVQPMTKNAQGLRKDMMTHPSKPSEDQVVAVEWSIPTDIADLRRDECKGKLVSSTGGFCIGQKGVHYMGADEGLVLALGPLINGGSLTDLGAGKGWYGKALLAHPTHPISAYTGYDGALNVEEKSDGFVKHMDLTQPSAVDKRTCSDASDWVLSIEVAEHIPPAFADSYLRNVRCRARKGAILSWGEPDQPGLGHVNGKTHEDAVMLVERWGFTHDKEATDELMKHAKFLHLKKTLAVYRVSSP
jgi:hypothetical protein